MKLFFSDSVTLFGVKGAALITQIAGFLRYTGRAYITGMNEIMALTIRVLLENRLAAHADPALTAKAGLSLLLEDETSKVLFDTGPDGSFLKNAQRMGIKLDNLTATVLSHGPLRSLRWRPLAAGGEPNYLSSTAYPTALCRYQPWPARTQNQKTLA